MIHGVPVHGAAAQGFGGRDTLQREPYQSSNVLQNTNVPEDRKLGLKAMVRPKRHHSVERQDNIYNGLDNMPHMYFVMQLRCLMSRQAP